MLIFKPLRSYKMNFKTFCLPYEHSAASAKVIVVSTNILSSHQFKNLSFPIYIRRSKNYTYLHFFMINQYRCFGVNLDFTIKNSASTYFLQYVLLHWVSVKRAVRLMHATRVRLVTTKIRPTTHAKVDYYSSVYIGTYSRRTTVNT